MRDTLTWNFKKAAWVWLHGQPAVCLVSGSCHIAGSGVGTVACRKVETLSGHGGRILNSVWAACPDGAPDAHSTGEVKLLFWVCTF